MPSSNQTFYNSVLLACTPIERRLITVPAIWPKNWAAKLITTLYGKNAICALHFFIQRINQTTDDRVALCRGGKELSKKSKQWDEWTFSQNGFDARFRALQPVLAAQEINLS